MRQVLAITEALNRCFYNEKIHYDVNACKKAVKGVNAVTDEEAEEICTAAGCNKGEDEEKKKMQAAFLKDMNDFMG